MTRNPRAVRAIVSVSILAGLVLAGLATWLLDPAPILVIPLFLVTFVVTVFVWHSTVGLALAFAVGLWLARRRHRRER